jgi:hypothetical protein
MQFNLLSCPDRRGFCAFQELASVAKYWLEWALGHAIPLPLAVVRLLISTKIRQRQYVVVRSEVAIRI